MKLFHYEYNENNKHDNIANTPCYTLPCFIIFKFILGNLFVLNLIPCLGLPDNLITLDIVLYFCQFISIPLCNVLAHYYFKIQVLASQVHSTNLCSFHKILVCFAFSLVSIMSIKECSIISIC